MVPVVDIKLFLAVRTEEMRLAYRPIDSYYHIQRIELGLGTVQSVAVVENFRLKKYI